MMDDEIVKSRKWVDRETFVDLSELASHLGYKRVG